MSWHADEDLERLDAALMALPADNDPMLLTEFDGFCAGLITCPEMIPPSVWLRQVWGPDGAPEFKNLAEMQATLDLIMAHYNRVAAMLMMPGEYFPVLDEDRRNGDILWEFWMLGFLAAMRLQPKAWEAVGESGDARALKAYHKIDELGRIAMGLAKGKKVKASKVVKQAPDLIPDMVEDLNHFAKSLAPSLPLGFPLAANLPSAPVVGPRVGRNDPCPCGSGKKFKKCCGAGNLPLH
ncbi:MAG: UPF0149 family protein [Cypionkella sp.]